MKSRPLALSTALGILLSLAFSSCGDGGADWDVARSLSYDWAIEKCPTGIAHVDKMSSAPPDEAGLVMEFRLLSTYVSTLHSSIEGAYVGPDSEIKTEIGELLEQVKLVDEECEKMSDLGSAILGGNAADNPDQPIKTLREFEAAARGQLKKYRDFFESTQTTLEDLRNADDGTLRPVFGRYTDRMRERAQGIDDRPVQVLQRVILVAIVADPDPEARDLPDLPHQRLQAVERKLLGPIGRDDDQDFHHRQPVR